MDSITKKCYKCKTEKNIEEFYKNKNECKICSKLIKREWYAKNTEKVRLYNKSWRENNKEWLESNCEKAKSKSREWYKNNTQRARNRINKAYKDNPEKIKNRINSWRERFPEKVSAINNNRRSVELKADGFFTAKQWKELCEKYNNKCLCCGAETELTVDHVIPLSKGGTNWIDNLQPLCKPCNSSKHTKTIDYRPPENRL